MKLSQLFGVRFHIFYTLLSSPDSPAAPPFVTNVKYEHPVLGTGWLSASGCLRLYDEITVEVSSRGTTLDGPRFPWFHAKATKTSLPPQVVFDTFWFDLGEDNLRKHIYFSDTATAADSFVTIIGRLAFLPMFARFPVHALDSEAGLAVFRFPPLASDIAVRRSMLI